MGLKTLAIRSDFINKEAAPDAVFQFTIEERKDKHSLLTVEEIIKKYNINPCLGDEQVFFDDALTRIRNVIFHRIDIYEAWKLLMKCVEEVLHVPCIKVFILSVDYKPNVPIEKAVEQDKRDQAKMNAFQAAMEKYKLGCHTCGHERTVHKNEKGACTRIMCDCEAYKGSTFYGKEMTDEGILKKRKEFEEKERKALLEDPDKDIPYPDDTEITRDGLVYFSMTQRKQITEQKFNFEKLISNRTLRLKFYQFVNDRAKENEVVFPTKTLLFLFEGHGVWAHNYKHFQFLAGLFEGHGETDMDIPDVLYLFHEYPIYIQTIDTDCIPITFAYLAIAPPELRPKHVRWICNRSYTDQGDEESVQLLKVKKKVKYLESTDMVLACEKALKFSKLNITQLIFAMIICGTDYVSKGLLCHYMSFPKVLVAMQYCSDFIFSGRGKTLKRMDALRFYARWQYTLLLTTESAMKAVTFAEDSNKRKLVQSTIVPSNKMAYVPDDFPEEMPKTKTYMDEMKEDNSKALKVLLKDTPIPMDIIESELEGLLINTPLEPFSEERIRHAMAYCKSKDKLTLYKDYPSDQDFSQLLDQVTFQMNYWLKSWQVRTIQKVHPRVMVSDCLMKGLPVLSATDFMDS
jgi:hypothetical protein